MPAYWREFGVLAKPVDEVKFAVGTSDDRGMADPIFLVSAIASAAAAGGAAFAAVRSSRHGAALATTVGELAKGANEQAESMRHLANLTADSMRAATGTYVFELRDRFDLAMPAPQIGVSDSHWGPVGEAPGPVEALVFHAGDRLRFAVTVVCNQAPLTRVITIRAGDGSGEQRGPATLETPVFTATSARTGNAWSFDLPSDVSLFVDLPLEVDVADLALGPFELVVPALIVVTNTRPEGATSSTPISIRVSGIVVPDDDGVGIDAVAIEGLIGSELRRYDLDKASRLELAMPLPAYSV